MSQLRLLELGKVEHNQLDEEVLFQNLVCILQVLNLQVYFHFHQLQHPLEQPCIHPLNQQKDK